MRECSFGRGLAPIGKIREEMQAAKFVIMHALGHSERLHMFSKQLPNCASRRKTGDFRYLKIRTILRDLPTGVCVGSIAHSGPQKQKIMPVRWTRTQLTVHRQWHVGAATLTADHYRNFSHLAWNFAHPTHDTDKWSGCVIHIDILK